MNNGIDCKYLDLGCVASDGEMMEPSDSWSAATQANVDLFNEIK